jgi:hypothetical protein
LKQWWSPGQEVNFNETPWPSKIGDKSFVDSYNAYYVAGALHGRSALKLGNSANYDPGYITLNTPFNLSHDKPWTLVMVGGYENTGGITNDHAIFVNDIYSPTSYVTLYLWASQSADIGARLHGCVHYSTVKPVVGGPFDLYTELGNTSSCVPRTIRISGTLLPFVYVLRNNGSGTACFRQHDGSSPQEFNSTQQNKSWTGTVTISHVFSGRSDGDIDFWLGELMLFDKALSIGEIMSEYGMLFYQYIQPKYNLNPFIMSWMPFDRWPAGTSAEGFRGIWLRPLYQSMCDRRNIALRPMNQLAQVKVTRIQTRWDYMDYYAGNTYVDGLSKGWFYNVYGNEPWTTRSLD